MKSQEILAFFYHSYKLTLLSNNAEGDCGEVMLCSHTKLHYSQTVSFKNCFQLKLCTHTKLHYSQTLCPICSATVLLCTLTKLHYSQTTTIVQWQWFVLYTHTNLHYSQTIISSTLSLVCFAPIQNYTTLKLALIVPTLKSRFVPIQNYTTLKQIVDGYVNEMWLYTHTKLHYSQTSNI